MKPYARMALFCAVSVVGCEASEPAAIGGASFALSSSKPDGEFRFIGTINLLSENAGVATSIVADANSPATHSVPLTPGDYRVEVADGYTCAYTGPRVGFTGCTFLNASLNPFQVFSGNTTEVALRFRFSFVPSQDVTVLFQTGSVAISLDPVAEASATCGNGAGCAERELCASLEGEAARCYAMCETNADCASPLECRAFRTALAGGDALWLCSSSGTGHCATPDCPDDTTAPALAALSFAPTSIDTTLGDATVTVSAMFSDNLSGVAYGYVRFQSPSRNQLRACGLSATGTGECSFPRFSEAGTWNIDFLQTSDVVGNTRFWGTTELQAAGFATALEVVSEQDTAPPTMTELSFTPTSVDTTLTDATVMVSATFSDDLSGVTYGYVRFQSPSRNQFRACGLSASGTGECSFPRYGEAGTWNIDFMQTGDAVGNTRTWGTAELQAAGFATSLEVVSEQDTTPPVLIALSFTPTSIDTALDDATVMVAAMFSDDFAGVAYGYVRFQSPSRNQFRACGLSASGIGECSFPRYSESGTWIIDYLQATDNVGNTTVWNSESLQAAGIPNALDVHE